MPLLYRPIQNSIESQDGKKKWRPTLVKFNKVITTQKIAQEIADLSAQSPGDVYNLLQNLATVMKRYLLNSFSVNLEGLGTFTIIAKSNGNGVDTAEEVKPTQIKNLRVQFTPTRTRSANGTMTRSMTDGVTFELYGSQLKSGIALPDGSGGNDDGDDSGGGWVDPTA
ncbi:HU family DNA-binding protein [Bacteroides sp. 519]|uniref:HU family DNA-binding protein n=1 Tax=Bacteroides sp. 519 TaxID=2302937 RepID=UPI0013D784FC|nr:HU family DNA-binding protein [Bacteroides sp. 519]NDV60150.1 DNA-binding protein [Bacteroides sp. 519]